MLPGVLLLRVVILLMCRCGLERHSGKDFGKVDSLVFARSSIKMLQALSLVESGAVEKYSSPQPILLLRAVLIGRDELHTDLVSCWLEQMGLSQEQLVCGAHEPFDLRVAKKLIKRACRPAGCTIIVQVSTRDICTAMVMNQTASTTTTGIILFKND